MDNKTTMVGTPYVPAPISQMSGYELDLLKFGYFGWVNALSIASEFWLQQFASVAPENDAT